MEMLAVSGIVLSASVYIIRQYSKGAKDKAKAIPVSPCVGCNKECNCK